VAIKGPPSSHSDALPVFSFSDAACGAVCMRRRTFKDGFNEHKSLGIYSEQNFGQLGILPPVFFSLQQILELTKKLFRFWKIGADWTNKAGCKRRYSEILDVLMAKLPGFCHCPGL